LANEDPLKFQRISLLKSEGISSFEISAPKVGGALAMGSKLSWSKGGFRLQDPPARSKFLAAAGNCSKSIKNGWRRFHAKPGNRNQTPAFSEFSFERGSLAFRYQQTVLTDAKPT
jgi:hypothetical protein|tara:strand:+ start:173 stop:517 length:345 start_codon:yes stop_codon:yes gene_type:complete